MFSHENSIIGVSNQARKWNFLTGLIFCSSAVAILGLIVISCDYRVCVFFLTLLGEYVWFSLILLGIVIVLVAMLALSLSIRCPKCSLRWFWYGMSKDFNRNIGLGYMRNCPRCGYPEENKVEKPVFISNQSVLETSNQINKCRYILTAFFFACAFILIGAVGLVYNEELFYFWRACFLGGIIGAGSMLLSLWISIKCPQCGLRWYWYAFSKNKKYLRMSRINHCPRCHYPKSRSANS